MGSTPNRLGNRQRLAAASKWYDARLDLHHHLARKVGDILKELLSARGIQFDRVEVRVKTRKSFQEKAGKQHRGRAKYREPANEIKDVVGGRVITYLDSMVREVGDVIEQEFEIDRANSLDKGEALGTDRMGYRSRHYVATLGRKRVELPECAEFKDIPFEIQARSLLQHAWAEMEHDRRFKYRGELPDDIKRRFSVLAAQLESADREFNSLARDVDDHAEAVARSAAGTEADEALTVENATAYLRGVLAEHLPSGRVEPGLGGDGATEMLAELMSFGIKTLGHLAKLFPRDFAGRFPETLREQTTFIGLLRHAMILTDAERYFANAWSRRRWSAIPQAEAAFYGAHGIDIQPLLTKHRIAREEDLLEEEHEIEWMDGPRKAITAAIENLKWDFDRRVVTAPNLHYDDHRPGGPTVEIGTREELISYLDEVGFEPYNASAPRADGEWVFDYDDSVGDELLSDMCADELERIGWE